MSVHMWVLLALLILVSGGMVDVAGARAGGAFLCIGNFIVFSYAILLVSCCSANADSVLLNCYSLLLEEKAGVFINTIPSYHCLLNQKLVASLLPEENTQNRLPGVKFKSQTIPNLIANVLSGPVYYVNVLLGCPYGLNFPRTSYNAGPCFYFCWYFDSVLKQNLLKYF